MAKEKKTIQSIDDFFADVRDAKHRKLEDSFNHYEKVAGEERLTEMSNYLIQPAMEEFYKTFVSELDKLDIADNKSIGKKKKKDVQKAAVEAFKAYFKKAGRKGINEALKGVEDVDDQYKILAMHYNEDVIGKQGAIESLIENYVDNKNLTLGDMKRDFYQAKGQHAQSAVERARQKAFMTLLGTYQTPEIAAHLKKTAGKKGYEVTDDTRFMTHDLGRLQQVYHGLRDDNFGKDGPGGYYLKLKEKKEK